MKTKSIFTPIEDANLFIAESRVKKTVTITQKGNIITKITKTKLLC
jgi:hypothetical protein